MIHGYRTLLAGLCGFTLAVSQVAAQVAGLGVLPWDLADYPEGGEPLRAVVADTLIDSGDLIIPTCNELAPGKVPQIASGITGIAQSIADSDDDNAAMIVDGLPYCCELLSRADADARISLGVAIAMKARALTKSDLQTAQEMELIVAICDDDVLSRSYELTRGQDKTGELIAQVGDPNEPKEPDIALDPDPGGGLESNN